MSKKPTVLMILDGYGLNDKCEHNAVCEAKTPIMDQLMSQCPYVKGQASGLAVGLPDGQMGNSEVGHLNMGAGRVVYQELTRITKAIQDGDFFENEELVKAVENAKANNSALHLFGLLSDGGVHSHITHVFGLLELAKRKGLEKVYVHCFLLFRIEQKIFSSGTGFLDIQCRENSLFGKLAVKDKLHVSGSLELFVYDIVHLASGIDKCRCQDRQASALTHISRCSEETFRHMQCRRVKTAG